MLYNYPLRSLRDALRRVLSQEGEYILDARDVLRVARRVLSPYKGARVLELRGGVLVVGARSPAVRTDLAMSAEELRETMNRLLGRELIKEVRIVGL